MDEPGHAARGASVRGTSGGDGSRFAARDAGGECGGGGRNPSDFQVRNREAASAFQSLYTDSRDPMLHAAGRETFEAVALLQSIQKQRYEPAAGANYPKGRFGDCLRQIAQLIKADVGLEMAFADVGGWDHHVNEVGARASEGQLAARLTDFGERWRLSGRT